MGISDKVGQMVSSLQNGAKNASQSVLSLLIKMVSVFVIGLTLAMIGQELVHYGTLGFVFVLLIFAAGLFRAIYTWTLGATLVMDLVCILLALLLRMYIFIAP